MVSVRALNKLGISDAILRRRALILFPTAGNWSRAEFTDESVISYELTLLLLLTDHLVTFASMNESTALAVVLHFRDSVTRYAFEAGDIIDTYKRKPDEVIKAKFTCFEILDGKWARMGDCTELYDLKANAVVHASNLANMGVFYLWSHSVALLPLLMAACLTPEEMGGHSNCRKEEVAGSHG